MAKLRFLVFILLASLVAIISAQTASAQQETCIVIQAVNVRSVPSSLGNEPTGSLSVSQQITVIQKRGGWIEHSTGWTYEPGYLDCSGVYTLQWLQSIAEETNVIDLINIAWDSRSGDQWKSGEAKAGTYDIPANSVVIGSMNAGNNPAFKRVGSHPNVWFTEEGGRFGTAEGFRAFQLDGEALPLTAPNSVTEMRELIAGKTYGKQIEILDVIWSGNPQVLNRWGTSGPLEVLTSAQIQQIGRQNLQSVKQLLPGNTIVWGELSDRNEHWGLERIAENVYRTTGDGGMFATLRGFRAMQFPSQ